MDRSNGRPASRSHLCRAKGRPPSRNRLEGARNRRPSRSRLAAAARGGEAKEHQSAGEELRLPGWAAGRGRFLSRCQAPLRTSLPAEYTRRPRPSILTAGRAMTASSSAPRHALHAGLAIGISGAPESTAGSGSVRAIARCRELGLEALEIAWVHRVSVTPAGAAAIRTAGEAHGIALSVHAPYAINLNSPDPAKVRASVERILASARGAQSAGATDVVLHLAYRHGTPAAVVGSQLADQLSAICHTLAEEGIAVTLRPETMGRQAEFGDLGEILWLCRQVPGLAPCIDIAHLHARSGDFRTAADFHRLWDEVAGTLSPAALARVHLHLSGIAYGPAGEVRHLALDEADLDYHTFLQVAAERGIRGRLLVESPARERDALLVQEAWRAIVARRPDAAAQNGQAQPSSASRAS